MPLLTADASRNLKDFLRKRSRQKQHEEGEMVKAGVGWSATELWLQAGQEGAMWGRGGLNSVPLTQGSASLLK